MTPTPSQPLVGWNLQSWRCVAWRCRCGTVPPACCNQAIEWQAARTADEVIREREEMISQLEFADAEIRRSSQHSKWLDGCKTDAVRQLAKEVNGFLFSELLAAVAYHDRDAVELFRRGVCIRYDCFGVIVRGGLLCRCSDAGRIVVQRHWQGHGTTSQ
jgi:hypothetical protein